MKNPELDYYRAAIGQILADAGINRSTIREMVKEIIKEKVDKELAVILRNTVECCTSHYTIKKAVEEAVHDIVKKEVGKVAIEVNVSKLLD